MSTSAVLRRSAATWPSDATPSDATEDERRVTTSEIHSALVVGSGLIGTSVALALRGHGVVVHLTDRDPDAVRRAADLGAGDPAPPREQVDLAVVAVSPSATASVVAGLIAGNVAKTVVDTCGVKADVLRDVKQQVGEPVHFVGTHPMAGRERSGPGAARADLFDGRPWVIVPDGVDPLSLARAERLVELCGGVAVQLDAKTHDDAVALVSHVPQVAATLVAARLAEGEEGALGLTGQGLRDVTRVAASDADLWVDVLVANAVPVARILTELRHDVDHVIAALNDSAHDPEWGRNALREVLLRGNAGRARLPGKHGGRATSYSLVPVVLPDRPGELARLFAAAGEAGVNIEDVSIEHSPGQPVGLVALAVAPGAEKQLAMALVARGWQVHS
ncbi:MAG: prephenate dehydrogenase [Actinomycetota bacterium]|jgi:prephenate dehydrogenase|nr:prephenate dehydrogenase [Actinomycetota bacterium]MDQ1665179.1 prephenate dehydrogenase [Actinomycetota bacterium]